MNRRHLLAAALLTGAASVGAQSFPAKPIRLVVGFAPGGVTDSTARLIAQKLGERLGQPVVVDNRAGANGILAADLVAKAPADGYTLVLGETGPNSLNPSLYAKLPYDARKDFTAVAHLALVNALLVASKGSGIASPADLLRIAKARPGQLSYSSAGPGHLTHVGMEAIKVKNNVFMTHIPYRGGAPALMDVVSNTVDLNITSVSTGRSFVQQGKVVPVAITAQKRDPAMPDVPTFAEAGLTSFPVDGWIGLLAPAGTPAPVVERLNREANEVLKMKDVRERMQAAGLEPGGGSPEEFRQFMLSQIDLWGQIVKRVGMKLE